MATLAAVLAVRGLGKQKMSELAEQAKRLGMTPERYVKHLVEENLAIAREARTRTFAELTGPGREVDETELDRLVEESKTRYHRLAKRKR